MKKLIVVILVWLCSQSYCMYQGFIFNDGVNRNELYMDDRMAGVVANKLLFYFSNNGIYSTPSVESIERELGDIVTFVRTVVFFDRWHVRNRGCDFFVNPDRHSYTSRLFGVFISHDDEANDEIMEKLTLAMQLIRISEHDFDQFDTEMAGMSIMRLRQIYLSQYSSMCNFYKVLVKIEQNVTDGNIDAIQCKVIKRVCQLIRSIGTVVVRVGLLVMDSEAG